MSKKNRIGIVEPLSKDILLEPPKKVIVEPSSKEIPLEPPKKVIVEPLSKEIPLEPPKKVIVEPLKKAIEDPPKKVIVEPINNIDLCKNKRELEHFDLNELKEWISKNSISLNRVNQRYKQDIINLVWENLDSDSD
jgi:hypothetical protein